GRGSPARKDAKRAAAGPGGTSAHRDHALHAESDGQIDGGPKTGLRIAALRRVGVQKIACGVDGRQPDAVFRQLPGKAVAFSTLPDRRQIEMRPRPRPPGADAELDVCDAALRAPREQGAPVEMGERIRIDSDSHATAFMNAEVRNSTSRRACSTVVCTG